MAGNGSGEIRLVPITVEIGEKQVELEKYLVYHFNMLKKNCSGNQQDKLKSLFNEAMMENPHNLRPR